MKKSVVLGLLLAAALGLGLVQEAGAQVWQEWISHNVNGGIDGFTASLDGRGGICLAGFTPVGGGTDILTVKYDTSGALLWSRNYGFPGSYEEVARGLAVDSSGNIFVTGTLLDPQGVQTQNADFGTLKYSPNGDLLWLSIHDGSGQNDVPLALALGGETNVAVTGPSTTTTSLNDYYTVLYNSDGQEIWTNTYNGPANSWDNSCAVVIDANDNVIVSGYSFGIESKNCTTVKYSFSGQELWVARYPSQSSGQFVALDDSGNIYVAGSVYNGQNDDCLLIKYRPNGVMEWASQRGINGGDGATKVQIFGQMVYVAGTSGGGNFSNSHDFFLLKYNLAGQEQWLATYGIANRNDYVYDLALDMTGNAYLTGPSNGHFIPTEPYDIATVKFDPDGQCEWVINYQTPYSDVSNVVMIDNMEQIYIAGDSADSLLLIKYGQTSHILDVTLNPINPPIVIPANGGSFNFNISIERTVAPQAPYAAWARIKNPDGTYTPPTLGPVTINTPVGVTITRQRSQSVPGSWASGVYTYLGYANTTYSYPAIDSSSFTFTKTAISDGGATVWEAICTGELFPGEEIPQQAVGHPATPTTVISPNPFNPITAISFQLAASSQVSLRIYDTAGRLVSTLMDGWREAGTYSATFDGSKLAAGVYLVRLEAGSQVQVTMVVLLK